MDSAMPPESATLFCEPLGVWQERSLKSKKSTVPVAATGVPVTIALSWTMVPRGTVVLVMSVWLESWTSLVTIRSQPRVCRSSSARAEKAICRNAPARVVGAVEPG